MTRTSKISVFFALFAGTVVISGHAAGDDSQSGSSCVVVTSSAQFRGLGYSHIVTLDNQCSTLQLCDVSTNVDPTPVHKVALQPKEQQEVFTRSGSPTSVFTARVSCKSG